MLEDDDLFQRADICLDPPEVDELTDEGRHANADEYPGIRMGGAVVVDLISELEEEEPEDCYHLTFDNLFTSLKLVDVLTSKKIGCTGTVRANRTEQCPLKSINEMKNTKRGTYDFQQAENTGVIVVRWNDNNIVNAVSNAAGVNPLQSASRWSKAEKKRVKISQPFLIKHYNKTMGGCDRMDQNIAKYRVSIRSKKWWWAIFSFCLDLCVQQTWHMYRATPASEYIPMDLLAVRRAIADIYLKRSHAAARLELPNHPVGRVAKLDRRVPPAIRCDGLDHLVEHISKQRRCAQCGKKVKQICLKCNVPLHRKYCFVAFHTPV
ncbi:piggyBac transposable element-derived protein 2-like [Littorina saxatilis]|uniref:piggyBac transposable element-derived protein 2-like n=1 Tax=Littorina saxatilis TaxID=31220 RepID=UPI0038B4B7D2